VRAAPQTLTDKAIFPPQHLSWAVQEQALSLGGALSSIKLLMWIFVDNEQKKVEYTQNEATCAKVRAMKAKRGSKQS
jgi:hypothetical protein